MSPNLKKLKSFPSTKALRAITKIRKESDVFFPDLPGINLSDNDKKVAILISYLDIFPIFFEKYEQSIVLYNEYSATHYIKFVEFDENAPLFESSEEIQPLRLMFNEKEYSIFGSLFKFESVFETFIAGMVILSALKKFKSQEQMNKFFKKRFDGMFPYIEPTIHYTGNVNLADRILEKIGDINDWNLLQSYTSSGTDLKLYMMASLFEALNCKVTHEYFFIYKLASGRGNMTLKIADEFLKSESLNLKGIVEVLPQLKTFQTWMKTRKENNLMAWYLGQSKWTCSLNALRSFYTLAVNWKKSKDEKFKYPGVKDYACYEKWKLEIDNRLVNKLELELSVLIANYKGELDKKPRVISASEWKMIAHVSQLLIEIHQKGGRTTEQKIAFTHSKDFLKQISSKLEFPSEKGIDISSLISMKLAKFEYDFNKKDHEKFLVKDIAKNPNLRSDLFDV